MNVVITETEEGLYEPHFQIYLKPSYNVRKAKIERSFQQKKFQIFLKRTIDIIVSSLLITCLLPVLTIVAILIKLTSKGALLYSNERVGYKGKHFRCFKFRSMVTDQTVKISD